VNNKTKLACASYLAIALATLLAYAPAVKLMAIQSPWFNTVIGKASISTVLLLIMWVMFIEKLSKKKQWSSRRTWAMMMAGVFVLTLSVYYTPV